MYTQEYSFTIDVDDGQKYSIAAHTIVINENDPIDCDCPALEEISAMLPKTGNFILHQGNDDISKFIIEIFNDGFLNSDHEAWCIDRDHGIYYDSTYYSYFYSSYANIPAYLTTGDNPDIDYPENLDLVNWVLNNHEGYKNWETQNVIWKLIDSTPLDLTDTENI